MGWLEFPTVLCWLTEGGRKLYYNVNDYSAWQAENCFLIWHHLTVLKAQGLSRFLRDLSTLSHTGVKYGCLSNFLLKQGQLANCIQNFNGKMPLISLESATVISPRMWKQFWRITENRVTGCQKVKLAHWIALKYRRVGVLFISNIHCLIVMYATWGPREERLQMPWGHYNHEI